MSDKKRITLDEVEANSVLEALKAADQANIDRMLSGEITPADMAPVVEMHKIRLRFEKFASE